MLGSLFVVSRSRLRPSLMVAFLAMATLLPAQETREEALDLLARNSKEVRSWTSDYLMLMNAQGMAMTTEGHMEAEGVQLRNEMTIDMMGQNVPVVSITDANGVTWTESEVFGQKTVMKMDAAQLAGGVNPAAGQTAIDPRKFIELIRETPEAVYLGKEDLNGVEVLSFEMPLDEEMRQTFDATGQMAQLGVSPEKLQLMIAVSDGFPRLWQLLDAQGATITSVIYQNLKLNPEIPAGRFQYTPAEGGQVMDLSAIGAELLGGLGNSDSLASSPEVQELLGNLGESDSLASNPQLQELLGELNKSSSEEDEPKELKYNRKYGKGDTAPIFKAERLGGGTVDLADYKGKVVLLDFWATWSEPYLEDLPNLIAAHQDHADKGLVIIGINLDEDQAAVQTFLEAHPEVTWPQVFDGKGWSNAVGELYGIEAIPHRIMIDKDGIIYKTGLRGKGLPNRLNRYFTDPPAPE